MADLTLQQGTSLAPDVSIRYRDMGDGTHAMVQAARLIGGDGAISQDEITGALVAITVAHHEIHEGETFLVSYKSPDGDPVADNATLILLLTTGSKYVHLLARASCGGDLEAELREGTTHQGGTGVELVVYNKNRPKESNSNTATVLRDPTIVTSGTLLEVEFIPGGSGPFAVGGAGATRAEWVLARGTRYMVRLTNRAGNAQPMSATLEWYEESEN